MLYGAGISYLIYPKLKLNLQYELNDDLIKRPAAAYIGLVPSNTVKPDKDDLRYYGLRFQSQTIYFGVEYLF